MAAKEKSDNENYTGDVTQADQKAEHSYGFTRDFPRTVFVLPSEIAGGF